MSVGDIVKKYCVCADDYTKRGRVDPECRCDVWEDAINEAVAEAFERCAEIARAAENTHRGVESIALEIEARAAEAFCGLCGWRGKHGHMHACGVR